MNAQERFDCWKAKITAWGNVTFDDKAWYDYIGEKISRTVIKAASAELS
jgi:hypothetical protein